MCLVHVVIITVTIKKGLVKYTNPFAPLQQIAGKL